MPDSKKHSLKSVALTVNRVGWEMPVTPGMAWRPVSNTGAAKWGIGNQRWPNCVVEIAKKISHPKLKI